MIARRFWSVSMFAGALLWICAGSAAWREARAAGEPAVQPASRPELDQAALEKTFEKTLNHATLSGSYTMGDKDTPAGKDHYKINGVHKDRGDNWIFDVRIQYGSHDVTVPLSLPVKWAGDTPVIEVTDLFVPGIGTYTARVMIYNDQYVGTWKGTGHGGQLMGRITHAASPATGPTTRP